MAGNVLNATLNDGNKMPLIGLGTSRELGDALKTMLNLALEIGYRHIDTAHAYQNEAAIGEVLKTWLDSGKIKREELFVVTKLPGMGNRAESVEKYLKQSLQDLQLSYVDLYLVHSPVGSIEGTSNNPMDRAVDMNTDHISLWKAMEAQVDAGRARSIGLSNFNARQVKRIVRAARIPPASLQVELNVYFQQRELVAFCRALDVSVCAYSPLGSPGSRFRATGNWPTQDPVVLAVANKHNKTAGQVLLRHHVQRGIVAIPKSTNPSRLKENLQLGRPS
ncbi:aldo-keto reductase family 1 member A1-like isoform X2 [Bacillus rossius redtenbacheri]|uniref:aldo-keto reductase family 1 member A1-like isoform X2 n=1 Tax=Bacillus rossius redtenbacheri TaxID=93214 RepID=UPI002FDCCE63